MSENGCVFCKVAGGEEESEIVHDEEGMMAFHSIGGQAPVHVLVIPKEHIFSLQEIDKFPDGVAKRIFEVAREVAERMGIEASGYACRINNGPDSRQEAFHLHAHVMGGRKIGMP